MLGWFRRGQGYHYIQIINLSSLMSRIVTCGPKKEDGSREAVSNNCTPKCKFYKQCVDEIGAKKLKYHIVELDPTEKDLKEGRGHLNKNKEIKVWARVAI